jgi:hypothetical protein
MLPDGENHTGNPREIEITITDTKIRDSCER